jgi:hypothetical protein
MMVLALLLTFARTAPVEEAAHRVCQLLEHTHRPLFECSTNLCVGSATAKLIVLTYTSLEQAFLPAA